MKASELEKLIRKIVSEEVRRQLPGVLSEMYVKKIVSESVQAKPTQRQRTLMETLGEEDEDIPPKRLTPVPQQQMNKEQLRQKIRNAVLEDPMSNPMAFIYEGVNPIPGDSPGMTGDESEGIPLEMLQVPTRDFSTFINAPPKSQSIPETENMVMKRLEEQRKKLDSVKVG